MSRTFNVVLFGNEGVGIQCLIEKFLEDSENRDFDFHGNQISDIIYLNDGNESKLCFWKHSNITEAQRKRNFFHGYIMVFDVTKNQTFENLEATKNLIKESYDKDSTLIFVVANKCDLGANRTVSNSTGQDWCDSQTIPLMYFETSALTGKGVHEAFSTIANVLAQAEFPSHQRRYSLSNSSSSSEEEVNRYIRPQKEKIDDIEPLDEYYGVAQVRNNIEKKPVLDDATELCVELKKLRLQKSLKSGKLQQSDYDRRLAEIENTF